MMKLTEAVAKQAPTAMPGNPMPRKSLPVPAIPSRVSINPKRNNAAKSDRQKTTVQTSSISRKRASVPPKLQTTADIRTRNMPWVWLRDGSAGACKGVDDMVLPALDTGNDLRHKAQILPQNLS